TVTFTYVFAQSGSHTVAVGAASTSATIAAVPPPDLTTLYALAGGLLVAGLVIGVVVGRVMGRSRKKPPTSMPGESGTGGTAEEELPPEETLQAESDRAIALGPLSLYRAHRFPLVTRCG